MADRTGYDQLGDGYPSEHATIGVDVPNPYQQEIPSPNHSYAQQQYPMQQPYTHNTNANAVLNQPQSEIVDIQPRPPDYMVPSIIACLLFLPTAMIAIVYAYKAYKLVNAGDYEVARQMSDKARALIIISAMFGIIWFVYLVRQLTVY